MPGLSYLHYKGLEFVGGIGVVDTVVLIQVDNDLQTTPLDNLYGAQDD